MPAGTNPAADNTLEYQVAELQRQLENLTTATADGGFVAGDYLFSERAHPSMATTTLSDGGRPGWWLANGATISAADDKALIAVLNGAVVLPNLKGKAVVAPDGVTFAGRGTVVGAETVALTAAQLAAHTHGVGTLAVSPNPHSHGTSGGGLVVGEVNSTANITVGGGGYGLHSLTNITLSIAGASGDAGGGTGHTNVQPTRVCGAVWIKR